MTELVEVIDELAKSRYMDDQVMYVISRGDSGAYSRTSISTGDHVHIRSQFDGDTHFYVSEITREAFILKERNAGVQMEYLTHKEMVNGLLNSSITVTPERFHEMDRV